MYLLTLLVTHVGRVHTINKTQADFSVLIFFFSAKQKFITFTKRLKSSPSQYNVYGFSRNNDNMYYPLKIHEH